MNADVAGLTDVEGAEVLGCTRAAFRQRVSRARRTLKHVIDHRWHDLQRRYPELLARPT